MGFDLMEWCNDNQNICIFVLVLVVLQCTGYLTKILNMCGLEGFEWVIFLWMELLLRNL